MSVIQSIENKRRNENREQLAGRLLEAANASLDLLSIYLGDELGLYTVLADEGPLTPGELARRTGTDRRYIREWLEHQTVRGLLACDDPGADAEARRYSLPEGHDEVLADCENLDFLAPLAQLMVGAVKPIAQVVDAYRSGEGVPYSEYGEAFREGQGRMNRNMFLKQLGQEYLSAVPGLAERLARPGARIADIGCGVGWSSLGMAMSFPEAQVHGYDLDGPSIQRARAHAAQYGLGDRVQFKEKDAAEAGNGAAYDLVCALECVHDMAHPVEALRGMREIAAADGTVLIMDERVADRFADADRELDGFMYGWSVLHCLPVGRAEEHSACTGTVMKTETLRRYAREAGFEDVEVLPIENFFFRFYRLVP